MFLLSAFIFGQDLTAGTRKGEFASGIKDTTGTYLSCLKDPPTVLVEMEFHQHMLLYLKNQVPFFNPLHAFAPR
jgi:hypothetical protein